MNAQSLNALWKALREAWPRWPHAVQQLTIEGLRGIDALTLRFAYPVIVLAGPNGSGKSTVLNALRCAFGRSPTTVFPLFDNPLTKLADARGPARLLFEHRADPVSVLISARRRAKSWSVTIPPTGGAVRRQPIYARSLAAFSGPADLRSIQQMMRRPVSVETLPVDRIAAASALLRQDYSRIDRISYSNRDLLFATLPPVDTPTSYSELQMSSGERSLLHLMIDIAGQDGGLVLIDEVETGLHPALQSRLMAELQQIALRRSLQIVVTTHSDVVLESVPSEARVFLDRVDGKVVQAPLYHDVLERAMYDQQYRRLKILCEDIIAEYWILGVLDEIMPVIGGHPGMLDLGHDTGKDEFPTYIKALAKVSGIDDICFILDGDAVGRAEGRVRQTAAALGLEAALKLALLPGADGPEAWVWGRWNDHPAEHAAYLGLSLDSVRHALNGAKFQYQTASGSVAEKAKYMLGAAANGLQRDPQSFTRAAARLACQRTDIADSDTHRFAETLKTMISQWRRQIQ